MDPTELANTLAKLDTTRRQHAGYFKALHEATLPALWRSFADVDHRARQDTAALQDQIDAMAVELSGHVEAGSRCTAQDLREFLQELREFHAEADQADQAADVEGGA